MKIGSDRYCEFNKLGKKYKKIPLPKLNNRVLLPQILQEAPPAMFIN